jgi:hypothetical protein
MVEQVVGSGQRCAPSTSPVRRCSLPLSAVLQVDAACQRRDVAAASAALAAMATLAGVTAEKGARVWRRVWLVGLANYFWVAGGRARGDLGRTGEDAPVVGADANLVQIYARDGSGRTRRCGWIAPLRRTLAMHRSDRTSSDGSARWRCSNFYNIGVILKTR